jgi:hypothetical protein
VYVKFMQKEGYARYKLCGSLSCEIRGFFSILMMYYTDPILMWSNKARFSPDKKCRALSSEITIFIKR